MRRRECHETDHQHRRHDAGRRNGVDDRRQTAARRQQRRGSAVRDAVQANGDAATSHVTMITKITVDPTIMPTGSGLRSSSRRGIPRPSASTPRSRSSPTTRRVATMVSWPGDHLRRRLLVTDPIQSLGSRLRCRAPSIRPRTPGSFRSTLADRTAPRLDRMTTLLGCTPGNNPSNMTTLVINAKTKILRRSRQHHRLRRGLVQQRATRRYYLGASKDCAIQVVPDAAPRGSARRGRCRNQLPDREDPAVVEFAFGGGRFQAQPHLRAASCAGLRSSARVVIRQLLGQGFAAATMDASLSIGIRSKTTMITKETMITKDIMTTTNM